MINKKEVIINFENFDQNLYEQILLRMKKYSFCIIKNATNVEDLKKSMKLLKEKFDVRDDNPTTGENPESVRTNFQKLLIGGVKKKYNNFPRFFRTIYNPFWEEDKYRVHDNLKQVARVRNLLLGKELSYALEKVEDGGLWTAARIHQYPIGGGFFEAHRDTTVMDVAEEKKIEFYQLILVMTKKGEDFQEGGAFVEKSNERVIIEDYLEFGDIAIYDGTTVHGVEEIDPHRSLAIDKMEGRIAGFVSMYKVM